MASHIRTITVQEYIALAQQRGLPLYQTEKAWWNCVECFEATGSLERKRSGCPRCKGHGGTFMPTVYVPKQDQAKQARDALWRSMSEYMRTGRVFWP